MAQFLLGHSTQVTTYPIDALNSTPFIADDLSSAFGYLLTRFQVQRRPLPRTDCWYLYVARPKTSRWPRWLDRHVWQTGRLKRVTDRLQNSARSATAESTPDQTAKTGD